jgi:hypothetical protein
MGRFTFEKQHALAYCDVSSGKFPLQSPRPMLSARATARQAARIAFATTA